MLTLERDGMIKKRTMVVALIFLLIASFTYALNHNRGKTVIKTADTAVYIRVTPGMDAASIADLLYENNVIDSILEFKIVAKLNGLDGRLRAGNYTFYQGMPYKEIIYDLVNGNVSAIAVMIPEGYTIDQIAKTFAEKNVIDAELFKKEAVKFLPYPYITAADNVKYRAEGFLFPDTYEFSADSTAQEILQTMAQEFDSKFSPEMRERAQALDLNIQEVVILASLVEKEAQVNEDRPIIAQVFMNRLRQDMPLQSCATIQYILGEPKAELSIQDTKIESPYNTYQYMGLPPGPIANPGLASLKAVLFSQPVEYLYFVADKKGKHHFSRTYDEHLQAIDRIE